MQIVIDIREDFLYEIKHKHPNMRTELEQSVLDGTILPKGHGRLIDANDLDLKRIDIILSGEVKDTVDALSKMGMLIITAPTVIEADKAESEVEE